MEIPTVLQQETECAYVFRMVLVYSCCLGLRYGIVTIFWLVDTYDTIPACILL